MSAGLLDRVTPSPTRRHRVRPVRRRDSEASPIDPRPSSTRVREGTEEHARSSEWRSTMNLDDTFLHLGTLSAEGPEDDSNKGAGHGGKGGEEDGGHSDSRGR